MNFYQLTAAATVLTAMAGANAAEPIRPLPPAPAVDAVKRALGERLFHDASLSSDGSVSCASCHDLQRGGVDGLPVSVGVGGQLGPINAPTVFNSSLNFRQFWDGRAADLAEQADGPVHAPAEMNTSWEAMAEKLRADSSYVAAFTQVYGKDGLTATAIKDAIVAFETTLLTPSRFDDFLQGDTNALTDNEKQGYALFKSYGCVACHQGVNVGGNMFQTFGVMGDYFADRGGDLTEQDLGRFAVTGKEYDRHQFKVPTLRNIALTAPYFHDASAVDLDRAVEVMGIYQLGRPIDPQDRALILQFLHSLTGKSLENAP